MICMTYFYWKIYLTASRTTSALKRGVLITEKSAVSGCASMGGATVGGVASSDKSTSCLPSQRHRHQQQQQQRKQDNVASLRMHRGGSSGSKLSDHQQQQQQQHHHQQQQHHHHQQQQKYQQQMRVKGGSPRTRVKVPQHVVAAISRNGGRVTNVRQQLRRVNREKKAAKTVGIIVGAFVLCWLPFFSVYLASAFCGGGTECVATPTIFAIFFWLGYLNSAMNPFVYAYFSRDFRCAFERLLTSRRGCRCGCYVGAASSGPRGGATGAGAGVTAVSRADLGAGLPVRVRVLRPYRGRT